MDKRLLTEKEALRYVSMGRTNGRDWLREIGAVRRFGRSVRYDVKTIDKHLDQEEQCRTVGSAV